MNSRPWQTYILKVDGNRIFLGGGKSQGITPGMQFTVQTQGEQVKSPQTGAMVTLPGHAVAKIQVDALFGDGELNEGSVASIISGNLGGNKPEQLLIRYEGAK